MIVFVSLDTYNVGCATWAGRLWGKAAKSSETDREGFAGGVALRVVRFHARRPKGIKGMERDMTNKDTKNDNSNARPSEDKCPGPEECGESEAQCCDDSY